MTGFIPPAAGEVLLDQGPVVGLDGPPALAVMLARLGGFGAPPELVVSGINKGPNLGDDIIYSGTVSAAIEGALLGIPAIAVSLVTFENFQFQTAAEFTATLVSRIQERGMPLETLLNVNVPPLPKEQLKGWRLTRQGQRHYSKNIVERTDPRGKKYYWIGGDNLGFAHDDDTDCMAVHEGYVSVTPLQVDLTNYKLLQDSYVPNFNWP